MLKNSQIGEGWERRKQNKLGGKFDGRIRRDVEPDAASVAP